MENLDIWQLSEWFWSQEISEEDKKRVQEDAKKASQVRKQIKSQQKKKTEYAVFIALIFSTFSDDKEILNYLMEILPNLDTEFVKIKSIFEPILNQEHNYSLSDYVNSLKRYWRELSNKDVNLVMHLIKKKLIWNEEFWDKLDKDKAKKNQLLEEIKMELSKIWQK